MLPVQVSPDPSFGSNDRAGREGMPVCYIVDDDVRTCHFLSVILYGHGVRTEEFSDAPSFLQAVARRSPDLVFLDVGRDARETIGLTNALAEQGYFGFIQLMSTRGAAVLEHVKKIAEQQKLVALAGLTKPFQGREIVNIIHTLGLGDAAPPACRFGLDEALENNWIEYWYQPKIDLRRKQLVGVEAFVRARHPGYGNVLPTAFLPGASNDDLLSLARHTVTSALEAGARFSDMGVSLRLSVNIPFMALNELPLLDIIGTKSSHWPGLIIDIPEKDILSDLETTFDLAAKLMSANVGIAVDDFGESYSTLAKARKLPFAELKLGRAFIANCGSDRIHAQKCRKLIELAHNFEISAVAVGIEKASEVAALLSMGCDYGQGFLLGQPMSFDRLLALLRMRATKTTLAGA